MTFQKNIFFLILFKEDSFSFFVLFHNYSHVIHKESINV